MDAVVTFLFKYPSRLWERGEFVLSPVLPVWLIGVLALVAVVTYRRVQGISTGHRALLLSSRTGALLILVGSLLRPTLVVASAVPQRNVLAILLDDSRSMALKDGGEGTRAEQVERAVADCTALVRALADRFALRCYRVAADVRPAREAAGLRSGGTRTDLARALEQARELVRGVERVSACAQQQTQQGQQGQGQGGGENPRGGQMRDGNPNNGGMSDGRPGTLNSGQVRQLSREFGLRREDAEALRDHARAQGLDVTALNRAIDDLRRLESGRPLGDFRAGEELQAALLDRLKAFECALHRALTQSNGPRSALGARSAVPSEYRAQVEEYFRSLARPQPPPGPRP